MPMRIVLRKESANQLAMLIYLSLLALLVVKRKPHRAVSQIIQSALPVGLTCEGDKFQVRDNTYTKFYVTKEFIQTTFLDMLQPSVLLRSYETHLSF